MESSKTVIINAAYDKWYPRGQKRLLKSLNYVGYDGDFMHWTNDRINDYFDPQCNYTIKAAALHEAIMAGYRYILWLDCSIWAISDINPFMKSLADNGGFFMRSGYNCAQTSNDKALHYFGYTRDEAEKLPELWSCIFGFDMSNEQSRNCVEVFLGASTAGVFHGSREHDNQSLDKRFLFHRQDQTALSLAFHKCGMTSLVNPDTVLDKIFRMGGL